MSDATTVIRLNGYLNMPKESLSPGNGIGFAARGLLATMLSKPEGWRFAADRLAEEVGESRYSVLQTLKKLREAGYVRTIDLRDAASGNFSRVTWIRDSLQAPWPDETEVRISDYGSSEFGQTVPLVNPVEAITEEEKDLSRGDRSSESDEAFNAFWAAYPRKTAKKRAYAAWRRLPARKRAEAMFDLPAFVRGKEVQYIPHPATYLNDERWLDEPVSKKKATVAPAPTVVDSSDPFPIRVRF